MQLPWANVACLMSEINNEVSSRRDRDIDLIYEPSDTQTVG